MELLSDPAAAIAADLPPQDLAAEMSVIGSMLLSARAIDDVLEIVTGPEFYRPAHEVIFDAIAALHFDSQAVDAVTVADHLTKSGDLARAGGHAYLHEVIARVASPASAGYYAQIVAEKATLRRLVEVGTRIVGLGRGGTGEVSDLVAAAQSEVDRLAAGQSVELASATDTIPAVWSAIDDPTALLSTPWPSLDRLIGGLGPGRVYVIGARPGAGKSVTGLQLAAWWSQRHGLPVAVSSLEMGRLEVVQRMLSAMSSVPFQRVQNGPLTDSERRTLTEATETLRHLPTIWVDDRTSVDPGAVRAHARSASRRSGALGLVVVDYLQLMEGVGRAENRQQEVAKFSRAMKLLAKSMSVPVVVLSQLNRGSEHRDPGSGPRLADLRDSGAVEQDADVVILLHRPDADPDARGTVTPTAESVKVRVAKNRQGPQGGFALDFDGSRMRMLERPWSPSGMVG